MTSATPLGRLSAKIKQATEQISELKKERERLSAEVDLMKEENRRARRLSREHAEMVGERERLKARLEQLLDKLDQLKV